MKKNLDFWFLIVGVIWGLAYFILTLVYVNENKYAHFDGLMIISLSAFILARLETIIKILKK